MITRTYSELITLPTFKERFNYLNLNGIVGEETFGFDRYVNQKFYNSSIWRRIKDQIIIRDNGCEMSLEDYPISGRIYIHHMNPLQKEDIINQTEYLTNPEFLVCVSHNLHNAIHYGDENLIPKGPVIREKNDTCPWKH